MGRQGAASAASLTLRFPRDAKGGSISSIISPQFFIGRQGAASGASLALRFPLDAKGREHQQHHWLSGSHGAPRGGSISSIIGPQVCMGRQGAASAASLALRFPRSAKGREHQQHHWPSGLHGAASAASLALRFPRSAKGREHQQHH